MKKIAVLGYGVVGSGVVELFYRNRAKIEKNTKTELDIAYILDLREFPDDPYGNRVVHDIQTILDAYTQRADREYFAKLVPNGDIGEQDYNLSVSTYVEQEDTREVIDITALNAEIEKIVAREQVLRAEIDKIIGEIEA